MRRALAAGVRAGQRRAQARVDTELNPAVCTKPRLYRQGVNAHTISNAFGEETGMKELLPMASFMYLSKAHEGPILIHRGQEEQSLMLISQGVAEDVEPSSAGACAWWRCLEEKGRVPYNLSGADKNPYLLTFFVYCILCTR